MELGATLSFKEGDSLSISPRKPDKTVKSATWKILKKAESPIDVQLVSPIDMQLLAIRNIAGNVREENNDFKIGDDGTLTKQILTVQDEGRYTCEIEYSDKEEAHLYLVQVKKQGKNIDLKKYV